MASSFQLSARLPKAFFIRASWGIELHLTQSGLVMSQTSLASVFHETAAPVIV